MPSNHANIRRNITSTESTLDRQRNRDNNREQEVNKSQTSMFVELLQLGTFQVQLPTSPSHHSPQFNQFFPPPPSAVVFVFFLTFLKSSALKLPLFTFSRFTMPFIYHAQITVPHPITLCHTVLVIFRIKTFCSTNATLLRLKVTINAIRESEILNTTPPPPPYKQRTLKATTALPTLPQE